MMFFVQMFPRFSLPLPFKLNPLISLLRGSALLDNFPPHKKMTKYHIPIQPKGDKS